MLNVLVLVQRLFDAGCITQVVQDIAQKASTQTQATKGIRPVDKSQASRGKLDYVQVCASALRLP